jgi:hypothetical protein
LRPRSLFRLELVLKGEQFSVQRNRLPTRPFALCPGLPDGQICFQGCVCGGAYLGGCGLEGIVRSPFSKPGDARLDACFAHDWQGTERVGANNKEVTCVLRRRWRSVCLQPFNPEPRVVTFDFEVEGDAGEAYEFGPTTKEALGSRKPKPFRVDVLGLLSYVIHKVMQKLARRIFHRSSVMQVGFNSNAM